MADLMRARILMVEDNPLNLKLIGTCWSSKALT